MDLSNRYSCYIGTSRGTLSYTNLDPKSKIRYDFAEEPSEISSMVWGIKEHEIITGFKNGIVNIYDTCQEKYSTRVNCLKDKGAIVGLGWINNNILAVSNKGRISVLDSKKEIDNITTITSEDSTVESSVQNMNNKNIVATGGEMNDLKLWDVESKKCVFKAKSLGHDHLNLPIKASVRGITFIPGEDNLCCCVTKEGHILLYDERAQRKPVCKFFNQKASFTTIAPTYKQRNILAGTTKGYVECIDMKAGKCLKTFTNIGGSVTCLLCEPFESLVAVTSLDRFLRLFNLDTKELIYKQYLKQSLTKMVMKPIIKEESQDTNQSLNAVDEDEEYEDIFKNMEVVSEKASRKRNSVNVVKTKTKKIKK